MEVNRSTLPQLFTVWLTNQGYSRSTQANYLVDLRKYLSAVPDQDPLSSTALIGYSSQLSAQNNSGRQLASIKLFCHFAFTQKLIPQDFLEQNQPVKDIKPLLEDFKNYLQSKNLSHSTIKNYLNDVRQFVEYFQLDIRN